MKRLIGLTLLWVPAFLALLVSGTGRALADPITLKANTSITFQAGTSGGTVSPTGNSITVTNATGSSTITGISVSPQIDVAVTPGVFSNVTLGTFVATSTSTAPLPSGPSFNGAKVTLTVTFTVPGDISPKSFTAVMVGTLVQTESGLFVQWTSPTTLTFSSPSLGLITLTIESSTPINPPVNPSTGLGNPPSQIRGQIMVSDVIPEPATLFLLGGGLLGLSLAVRKGLQRTSN